jgi:hypothetical protein
MNILTVRGSRAVDAISTSFVHTSARWEPAISLVIAIASANLPALPRKMAAANRASTIAESPGRPLQGALTSDSHRPEATRLTKTSDVAERSDQQLML